MTPELPAMEAQTATPVRVSPRLHALRAIAGFEALKGAVALAAGLGFMSLAHHDLHHIAASLIGHIGLDPGGHYPAIILSDVDLLLGASTRTVLFAASAYVLVRFMQAYGLWCERPWGEWLGALSGALYVPFELRHLVHRPTLAAAMVVVCNMVIVGFLAWQLRQRRRGMVDTRLSAVAR
jgi:uncharacterized membrane protein (DUF2068 family)